MMKLDEKEGINFFDYLQAVANKEYERKEKLKEETKCCSPKVESDVDNIGSILRAKGPEVNDVKIKTYNLLELVKVLKPKQKAHLLGEKGFVVEWEGNTLVWADTKESLHCSKDILSAEFELIPEESYMQIMDIVAFRLLSEGKEMYTKLEDGSFHLINPATMIRAKHLFNKKWFKKVSN